jgi:hypothetical protein
MELDWTANLHKNTPDIPNFYYLTLKAEWLPRAMRFNIKKMYVLSTECIDAPQSVLKTNSSHFPTDNSPVFIAERICVLPRRTNWIFKYTLG